MRAPSSAPSSPGDRDESGVGIAASIEPARRLEEREERHELRRDLGNRLVGKGDFAGQPVDEEFLDVLHPPGEEIAVEVAPLEVEQAAHVLPGAVGLDGPGPEVVDQPIRAAS